MRNFRNLEIWNNAIELTKAIYILTDLLPCSEKYGLASQMQRAAVSIASNIAEGASRKTEVDFARFLDIALGSSFELETQLIISKEIGFISQELLDTQLNTLNTLQKQINSLVSKIRRTAVSI
jgi:four helix bundle protein